MAQSTKKIPNFYPVVLAGGSGTRFWPRSRQRLAKQVLALDGARTMIQQTVSRLLPLAEARNIWIITNQHLSVLIGRQLPGIPRNQRIAEPAARNTAPAVGLAAFLLADLDPGAVIGMFPSDQVIADEKSFQRVVRRAVSVARSGENIVVMGVRPRRPETGYGYIEAGASMKGNIQRVRRFTEKPSIERARQFLTEGKYYWNSGMFVCTARTLVAALREHLPETARLLEKIAAAYGSGNFAATLKRLYARCQNISMDYAVLEPRSARGEERSSLFCIPADFGWNDLGSWSSLYDHRVHAAGGNVIEASGNFVLDARGNYIHSPRKFVALVGVENLVVVETGDALLVTTRDRAQDVGKIVGHLRARKLEKLL